MLDLKKSLFIILVCACLLISLSCAFASEIEINNIGDADSGVVEVSASPINNQKLESSQSSLSDFDELQTDLENLSPGDVYYFEKDYSFDNQTDGIIDIQADNVKIEGKSHTMMLRKLHNI